MTTNLPTASGMDPIDELISSVRLAIMFRDAFLGNVITRMNFIEDTTGAIRTMGTDGVRVYYNREFIKNINIPQLVFVAAHEVVHAIAEHVARTGNREPKFWNMAIDAYTNALLVEMKLGEMPKIGIYKNEYKDLDKWSAESIYDDMLEKGIPVEIPLDDHLDMVEMGGDGNSDGAESDGDNEGGESQPGQPGNARVKIVSGDGTPIDVVDGDIESLRRQIMDNLLAATHAVGAGSQSGMLNRLVNAFLKPKVDWRGLLVASIRSLIKNDQSYTVYNKRSGQILFQGDVPEQCINVVLYIDASGSIDDDTLRVFLSEVYGIMTQFSNFKIHIAAFDTAVSNYRVYTPENYETLKEWKCEAGGGTDYGAFWRHLSTLDLENEEFTTVVLTDGQPADTATWNKKEIPGNVTDIVWILKNAPRTIQPPYGRWAHID